MAATIMISNGYANLPARIPHLMPFHIQHTGPAPVSTYFRIRPHVDPFSPSSSSVPETQPPSGDSRTEPTTTTDNTDVASEEKENAPVVPDAIGSATAEADVDMDGKALPSRVLPTGPIRRLSHSEKRFISSFRGRTVHGVEVALPEGYTGIVLRGSANGKASDHTTSSRTNRRLARRRLRKKPAVGGEEDEEDAAEIPPPEDEDGCRAVRVLKPSARFDSFVLWHPDIAVNEGRDEYLRSLSEWVSIATEVHQSETLPT
ncbi:ribonuclease H2, subunit C [Russula dissimulans]|nr:ribonuclease H2, subunit C [Russula dissimulans]